MGTNAIHATATPNSHNNDDSNRPVGTSYPVNSITNATANGNVGNGGPNESGFVGFQADEFPTVTNSGKTS